MTVGASYHPSTGHRKHPTAYSLLKKHEAKGSILLHDEFRRVHVPAGFLGFVFVFGFICCGGLNRGTPTPHLYFCKTQSINFLVIIIITTTAAAAAAGGRGTGSSGNNYWEFSIPLFIFLVL